MFILLMAGHTLTHRWQKSSTAKYRMQSTVQPISSLLAFTRVVKDDQVKIPAMK